DDVIQNIALAFREVFGHAFTPGRKNQTELMFSSIEPRLGCEVKLRALLFSGNIAIEADARELQGMFFRRDAVQPALDTRRKFLGFKGVPVGPEVPDAR